jgi:hypothetical protein
MSAANMEPETNKPTVVVHHDQEFELGFHIENWHVITSATSQLLIFAKTLKSMQ